MGTTAEYKRTPQAQRLALIDDAFGYIRAHYDGSLAQLPDDTQDELYQAACKLVEMLPRDIPDLFASDC